MIARRSLAALFLAFLATGPAFPGPILLTVTGLDPALYDQGRAEFDQSALEALGTASFTTGSVWTTGTHRFEGVPLLRLARSLGLAADAIVRLHALNDYEVEIPLAELQDGAPILAHLFDGKPMSVRDKGPIWLVYPYDADPAAYQTVTTFTRSVWQLDRIEVGR